MSGTLSIGGKQIFSHSDVTDKVTYGSGVPAGSVIQTKFAETETEYESTSTTPTTLVNLRLFITPTIANSKILIALNGTAKSGSNNGNIRQIYRFLANSNPIETFNPMYLNVSAIDDEANAIHLIKFYSHGQTSNFTQIQLDFDFYRDGSGSYLNHVFNFDTIVTNHATSYAMEIAP